MIDTTQSLGPVAVGGVGGSGTRLVASILREVGFDLGQDLNAALDDLWFTFLAVKPKWFIEGSDERIFKGLHLFIKARTGSLSFSSDDIGYMFQATSYQLRFDYLNWGKGGKRGAVKRVVKKVWPLKQIVLLMWVMKRVSTMMWIRKYDSSAYTGWGWKEPNSHIYLKYLTATFDNLKYIHIIRHGLDMAYSSNQTQLHNWGELFGIQPPDSPDLIPQASLNYWIKSNEAAITLGQSLLGSRFLALNFDQLCLSPPREIEKLVSFLELDKVNVDMNKLAGLCRPPRSLGRYKAHDLSLFDKEAIESVRELGFVVDGAGVT